MLKFFEQMRADAIQGKELKSNPAYTSVGRGLDHWGISSGELLTAAVSIGHSAQFL